METNHEDVPQMESETEEEKIELGRKITWLDGEEECVGIIESVDRKKVVVVYRGKKIIFDKSVVTGHREKAYFADCRWSFSGVPVQPDESTNI